MNAKQWWLFVILILLVSAAFSSNYLTTDMYWGDEISTLRKLGVPPYPRQNILEVITQVAITRWLPFYDLQLLVWGHLVGWSEFSTRVYSLFWGLLSISLMYRLGGDLVDEKMGIIAAILLGTSMVQIYYMHEMRAYTIYITLTIAVILIYQHILHRKKLTRLTKTTFVVVFALLMYTHYFAIFVIISIGLYHVIFERHSPNWMQIIQLFILTGILFIPWLPIAFINIKVEASSDRGMDTILVLQDVLMAYSNGIPILLLATLIYAWRTPQKRLLLFLGFCAVVFLMMSFMMNVIASSLIHIRHISGLFPFVLLIAALGIYELVSANRIIGAGVVAVVTFAGLNASVNTEAMANLYNTYKSIPMTVVDSAVEVATTCGTEDDALVTHISRNANRQWEQLSIEYYFHDVPYPFGMMGYLHDLRDVADERLTPVTDYVATRNKLLQDRSRVWVLSYPDAYKTSVVIELDEYLADEYTYCSKFVDSDTLIGYVYSNEPEANCSVVINQPISLSDCRAGLILNSVDD